MRHTGGSIRAPLHFASCTAAVSPAVPLSRCQGVAGVSPPHERVCCSTSAIPAAAGWAGLPQCVLPPPAPPGGGPPGEIHRSRGGGPGAVREVRYGSSGRTVRIPAADPACPPTDAAQRNEVTGFAFRYSTAPGHSGSPAGRHAPASPIGRIRHRIHRWGSSVTSDAQRYIYIYNHYGAAAPAGHGVGQRGPHEALQETASTTQMRAGAGIPSSCAFF